MSLTLALLLAAGTDVTCDSAKRCNELGTAAYKAGRFDEAILLFDTQIDYADTERFRAEQETPALNKAADVAINNAALAHLRAGQCLRARAYLEWADDSMPATQANRKQLDARCADAFARDAKHGTYWQYAGHGAWNQVQLAASGDGARLDAYWMRIGGGPASENGPAAIGSLEDVALTADPEHDGGLRGEFEGGDRMCELRIAYAHQAIEVTVTDEQDCQIGGMGAYLGGKYVLVEDAPAE